MNFSTSDEGLSITVELNTEPEALDLTAGGLGDQLLDAAVAGMLDAHDRAEHPEGGAWPELARSTVRQKGHAIIGYHTGRTGLLEPSRWQSAPRDITSRSATWYFAGNKGQGEGWQSGNERNNMPPRRIIGWTQTAQDECRAIIAQAVHELDAGGEIDT